MTHSIENLNTTLCIGSIIIDEFNVVNQLSFKYHSMDIFRIKALLKHLDIKGVKEQITKKASILIKGAKKHQNKEVEMFYQELLDSL